MDIVQLIIVHPAFAICLTVMAYALSDTIWVRSGRIAVLHPVIVATAVVAGVLMALGIPYAEYLRRTHLINDALAIVIVLLAVPLARQFRMIRGSWVPIGLALFLGALVAMGLSLALPLASGAGHAVMATIAPRSATTAVAVELADRFGGAPGLTAVIVISSALFGATFGLPMLLAAGVTDERAQGFALGVAANGIGTARAFLISETAGAFASLGMILNTILTILLVPMVLGRWLT